MLLLHKRSLYQHFQTAVSQPERNCPIHKQMSHESQACPASQNRVPDLNHIFITVSAGVHVTGRWRLQQTAVIEPLKLWGSAAGCGWDHAGVIARRTAIVPPPHPS